MNDYIKKHDYLDFKNILNDTNTTSNINRILLSAVPKGGKYNVARKMVKVFVDSDMKAPNYLLARCITSTVRGNNNKVRKLSKKDYKDNIEECKYKRKNGNKKVKSFDDQINNSFRTVRRFIKPDYTVKFYPDVSEIVKVS